MLEVVDHLVEVAEVEDLPFLALEAVVEGLLFLALEVAEVGRQPLVAPRSLVKKALPLPFSSSLLQAWRPSFLVLAHPSPSHFHSPQNPCFLMPWIPYHPICLQDHQVVEVEEGGFRQSLVGEVVEVVERQKLLLWVQQ